MHFRNKRLKLQKGKEKQAQAAPCPYHSRVSSIINQKEKDPFSKQAQNNAKSAERVKSRNQKNNNKQKQQHSLPKIKNRLSRAINHLDQQLQQQYQNYAERIQKNFDFYEDMKLNNEGWPTNPCFGKVSYARNQDIGLKSSEIVKRIYEDEYISVRQQLRLINRIKQRYKVLKNVENDKQKLNLLLKQMKRKKALTENEESEDELFN